VAETTLLQDEITRELRAHLASLTGGIALDDYALAWWEWYLGMAQNPAKQSEIAQTAFQAFADNVCFALQAAAGQPAAPTQTDRRFAGDQWGQWPFNILARGYLNWERVVDTATSKVPGVSQRNSDLVRFSSRQVTEATSPTNFLLSNPELLEQTRTESGQNLVMGFRNWLEDVQGLLTQNSNATQSEFKVGASVAATPGKVILRNDLIELIQYSPTTPAVHPEPILIVPAWIMKYYILDLSAHNSLVRYLVSRGHTVFMISWKNPQAADRNVGMDDYYNRGILAALDAVGAITPEVKTHAVGYCIGGTLLAIAAAALAGQGDSRLASATFFAAQTDFSEPGELSVFISPNQLSTLEAVMNKAGLLRSEQMAASFKLLRSRDLLWNPAIDSYIRGKREKLNDLMAWNADGTRMPCRMHSEYLRQLYLQNDLARGQFKVNGNVVRLDAIRIPMYVLGTEADHVAPWKSVYKTRALTNSSDFTFALVSGGHNGGIVCGPDNSKRRFRQLQSTDLNERLSSDQWLERAALKSGSWWPSWASWLAQHSGPLESPPPTMGNVPAGFPPIADAPGTFVLQR
jgi:polyhydroxyalkanoate synthase subunit PhaC